MITGVGKVEIVRPKKTGAEVAGGIVGHLIGYLISGWTVMLILGTITTLHMSYWHSVLLVVLVRTLVSNTDYFQWTKAAK